MWRTAGKKKVDPGIFDEDVQDTLQLIAELSGQIEQVERAMEPIPQSDPWKPIIVELVEAVKFLHFSVNTLIDWNGLRPD